MWMKLTSARWHRSVLLWSVLLAAMAAGFMAIYTYRGYQQAATDLVIQRDGQVTLLSAARLSNELSNYHEVLHALARTKGISDGNPETQRDELSSAALRLVVFDGGVVLLDRHGKVQAVEPARAEIMGQDWSKHETFRQVLARSEAYVSDVSNIGPNASPVVSLGVPILGPSSEFQGALLGMFSIGETSRSPLYASIVRLRLVQSGTLYVTDSTDLVLYSSTPGQIGTVVRHPDLPAIPAGPDSGAGRTTGETGNDVVTAFAPVPGTPWTLTTEDDWATLTASTRRYRDLFVASLIVATILPAVGTTILSRQRRLRLLGPGGAVDEERLARTVQHQLMPRHLPMMPGWSLSHRHRVTGGTYRDFADAALLEDGRLMLAIGRLKAGSAEAALAMASMRAAFRSAVSQMAEPCAAMAHANQLLCSSFPHAPEGGCLYAIVDPVGGTIQYSSAGHPPPLFTQGDSIRPDHEPSHRLGARLGSEFTGFSRAFPAGACMVIGTAPLMEARNAGGETFGASAVPSLLAEVEGRGETLAEAILTEFDRFVRTVPDRPSEVSFFALSHLRGESST